jgi:hypothetical protein
VPPSTPTWRSRCRVASSCCTRYGRSFTSAFTAASADFASSISSRFTIWPASVGSWNFAFAAAADQTHLRVALASRLQLGCALLELGRPLLRLLQLAGEAFDVGLVAILKLRHAVFEVAPRLLLSGEAVVDLLEPLVRHRPLRNGFLRCFGRLSGFFGHVFLLLVLRLAASYRVAGPVSGTSGAMLGV